MNQYYKLLSILEKTSIRIFNENVHLFKENVAFTALLLQGLTHSPNNRIYKKIIKNLVLNLLNLQNQAEGYFIEKYSNYSQPSALVSALAGIALIDSMDIVNEGIKKEILSSLEKINDFLIRQEINKGSYRKSFGFNYSIVNSNASITLFMILYYKISKKEFLLNKVYDFIDSLKLYTLKNGAITYGIRGQKYFIPSIYYHTLTLNHLLRMNLYIKSKKLSQYLKHYLNWLEDCYDKKGIKWEKSGFMFSTYLNQAYAFIIAINKIIDLKNKEYLCKLFNNNLFNGFLFRCDKIPGIIKRISISIHVGIKSADSVKFRFINSFLLITYSLILIFNIKPKPREYKINPIFKYLGIQSRVSPPIKNNLDFMTTIESYCYLALAYDLENRKRSKSLLLFNT